MKPIKSWEEADDVLRLLGVAEIGIEKLEHKLTLKIQELKDHCADLAKRDQAFAAECREALEAFWISNRPKDQKSRTLNHGSLGQRSSRAVKMLRGWTHKKALPALLLAKLLHFVRVKNELDKDAVLKASPAEVAKLRECGVGIEDRETFFAEPDRAVIAGKEVED